MTSRSFSWLTLHQQPGVGDQIGRSYDILSMGPKALFNSHSIFFSFWKWRLANCRKSPLPWWKLYFKLGIILQHGEISLLDVYKLAPLEMPNNARRSHIAFHRFVQNHRRHTLSSRTLNCIPPIQCAFLEHERNKVNLLLLDEVINREDLPLLSRIFYLDWVGGTRKRQQRRPQDILKITPLENCEPSLDDLC